MQRNLPGRLPRRSWRSLRPCFSPARRLPQDLKSFEQRITTKVLPNGLTIMICERPEAPVFSYTTFVDAGDVNDPSGESGLAHMFEHLAFKGTSEIGTTDYAGGKGGAGQSGSGEQRLRGRISASRWAAIRKKLAELKKAFDDAQAEAQKYVIPNQFTEVAERNGAHGLNAQTGLDETSTSGRCRRTGWSFGPGLRAAAWPIRFRASSTRSAPWCWKSAACAPIPIPRAGSSNSSLATAYVAHNYGRSGVGWPSEVSQITATEAMAFHKKYYVGSNIVIAVVGDVKAAEAMPMLEKYFSKVPGGPKPLKT